MPHDDIPNMFGRGSEVTLLKFSFVFFLLTKNYFVHDFEYLFPDIDEHGTCISHL